MWFIQFVSTTEQYHTLNLAHLIAEDLLLRSVESVGALMEHLLYVVAGELLRASSSYLKSSAPQRSPKK